MILKVLNPIEDIHTSEIYEVGTEIKVTVERRQELEENLKNVGGFDLYLEVIEDEKPKRKATKKTVDEELTEEDK